MNEATATGLRNNFWLEFDSMPFFANVPGVQAMNAALDKYYPGLRTNATLFVQADADAWYAGLLLRDAVKAGGLTASDTPSAAEVIKGLTSLKGDTIGGLVPPLTFTPGQPHAVSCWFTARVQNGVPSVVNNGQVTCANGSSG
jgi:branched-chain amino acid transport system substrate-binding protein